MSMKKFFKKFLHPFVISFLIGFIGAYFVLPMLVSWGTRSLLNPTDTTLGNPPTYIDSKIGRYNRIQFDSICTAEGLPNELHKWISLSLKDFETQKSILSFSIYRDKANSPEDIMFNTQLEVNNKDTVFIFEKRETKFK